MKMWIKAILGISLSFMCLFTCVGYAAVSGNVVINGNVEAEPPKALFITSVGGGNYLDPATLAYSGTIVTSNLTLRENASGIYEASFTITVFNNTTDSYYYHSMIHGTYTNESGDTVAYSNDDIVLDVVDETLKKGDELKAGEQKTFTVNASFKDGVDVNNASKELFSIINYYFSTTQPDPEDTGGGEAAVSGLLTRFPEILNDPQEYQELSQAMNANWSHPSYVGNVVSSWEILDDDTALIQDLFGVALSLNIDGEEVPVTVIIQRKNVDGNENTGDDYRGTFRTIKGCEMMLYMTPVKPSSVSGGTYIETYVITYTKQGDGDWYQIGEMYKGTAQVVGYVSGSTSFNDSINPSSWRQDETKKTIEQLIQGT